VVRSNRQSRLAMPIEADMLYNHPHTQVVLLTYLCASPEPSGIACNLGPACTRDKKV